MVDLPYKPYSEGLKLFGTHLPSRRKHPSNIIAKELDTSSSDNAIFAGNFEIFFDVKIFNFSSILKRKLLIISMKTF